MSSSEIEGLTIVKGIERIQDSFLFSGLSYDETRALAEICEVIEKRDGEVIIEENSIGQALYLVVAGGARVFGGEGASEKTIAHLKPGEIFGEMSLIEDMLTSSSVSAVGHTRLLRMDKMSLERLMAGNDRLSAKIYRSFCMALSERLRRANEMLSDG